jgi:hypothetical protein
MKRVRTEDIFINISLSNVDSLGAAPHRAELLRRGLGTARLKLALVARLKDSAQVS